MNDWTLAAIAIAVLCAGIGSCVLLHRLGVASTYTRDVLHIGTGVWVLGWPLWSGLTAPLSIVIGAAVATALVPIVARTSRTAARVQRTFASGDELWTGLVLYTTAYAALTWIGLSGQPFAAGAGLLALSLGDGIGGAVGRRFGKHHFTVPGGKTKSFEGSAAVAVAAALAVLVAAWRFDVVIGAPKVAGLGVAAAVAEALSPRGTDNVIVPATVWGLAEAVT